MLKAIIFDCFGVLAEDGWLPFKRKYIGDNTELSNLISDLGKQNEHGFITNDQYYEEVANLLNINKDLVINATGKSIPNIELFEYIKKHLKPKFKIGLLSNASFDVTKYLFNKNQTEVFDAIVLSRDAKLIKPDERVYRLIADKLGESLEECLMVDDIERYCQVASHFGMKTVVYKDFTQFKAEISQFL